VSKRIFELEVESAHLRAAFAAGLAAGDEAAMASIADRLREVRDARNAVGGGAGRPMQTLIDRLSLGPELVDFVWSAVAATCEPRMMAHLEMLAR
jgi:hypothetical protein